MIYPESIPLPSRLETELITILPIDADEVSYYECFEAYHDFDPGMPPDGDDGMEWTGCIKNHKARRGFSFFVFDNITKRVVGGVAISLAESAHKKDNNSTMKSASKFSNEAIVTFWILRSREVDDLDRHLFNILNRWFIQEWAFSKIFFRPEQFHNPKRQIQLFSEMDMEFKFSDTFGYPVYGRDEAM